MKWTLSELRHNASILHNHLCAKNADQVYVDTKGSLQVDGRNRFIRWLFPKGDASREATDKAAIRTLFNVLRAIEDGELDPQAIIMHNCNPSLLIGEDGAQEPLSIKWLSRELFGRNISKASRFTACMPSGHMGENPLSYEQRVCAKVALLTQMIIRGNSHYSTRSKDFFETIFV